MDKHSQLSNEIKTRFGSVVINPGTGAVLEGSLENAGSNMIVFMVDVAQKIIKETGNPLKDTLRYRRYAKNDYGDGRYCFRLYYDGKRSEIQMPGWTIDEVRFMQSEGQDAWQFPRLYVDDSSWLWCFAVNCATYDLLGSNDDDQPTPRTGIRLPGTR